MQGTIEDAVFGRTDATEAWMGRQASAAEEALAGRPSKHRGSGADGGPSDDCEARPTGACGCRRRRQHADADDATAAAAAATITTQK